MDWRHLWYCIESKAAVDSNEGFTLEKDSADTKNKCLTRCPLAVVTLIASDKEVSCLLPRRDWSKSKYLLHAAGSKYSHLVGSSRASAGGWFDKMSSPPCASFLKGRIASDGSFFLECPYHGWAFRFCTANVSCSIEGKYVSKRASAQHHYRQLSTRTVVRLYPGQLGNATKHRFLLICQEEVHRKIGFINTF